ncbi:MAG: YvcK family protein [Candidatus Nanopelagicales bacterium]|nr:YvcK family protein [Candidatus Nanopelagicales bacterium]
MTAARRPGAAGVPVVALGGGHGLAVSLRALRAVTDQLTAVVGMADDGGSSGRLRREIGVPPPGDLRMALAALCGDDVWGRTWSSVVQHRFRSGELAGHAVGNLLITALWEQTGDLVAGLDWVGALLGAHGRVLPASTDGLDIVAEVRDVPGQPGVSTVRGQSAVAVTPGTVLGIALDPPDPAASPQAVEAIEHARAIVMGPGSWYTSVMASLLVPGIRSAVQRAEALRILALNLVAQPGETAGFSPQNHLHVMAAAFPEVRFDVVLADPSHVPDEAALEEACALVGAELVLRPVADPRAEPGHHDPLLLGRAFGELIGHGSIPAWR